MITEEQIKQYRADYSFASSSLFKIQTKEAKITNFVFNRIQRYLWKILLEDLKAGRPVRWYIIKGRQFGISTWILGLFYWLMMFYPNRAGMVVAHEDPSAIKLAEKPRFMRRNIPVEIRPQAKTDNRHELYLGNPNQEGELGLESSLIVKTADSETLAASYTLHMALLSEFALWETLGMNVKERLGTALQTVPKKPGTFVFIETTARGEGYAKDLWDDNDSSYRKIFITWVGQDEYRLEINPEEYFILSDEESTKYGDEVEAAKIIEQHIIVWYPEIDSLTEPLRSQTIQHEIMCRMAWRRSMINDECQGDKNIFRREYPLTSEDAFGGYGSAIFSQNKLKDIKYYLEVISPSKCRRFRFDSNRRDFYESKFGPIRIYHAPDKNFRFCAGADPAQGIVDGDPTGLVFLRCPDLTQAVVFEEVIDPDEFALMLYCLLNFYNKPLCGIEANDKGGYHVIKVLKSFGYFNQYKREVLDSSNFKKTVQKFGWFTSTKTKPTMVADARNYIKYYDTSFRDLDIVNQLKKYKLLPNGHMKASDGKDHLADAFMIALQMSKFIHQGSYDLLQTKKKWTMNWWANVADSQFGDINSIGSNLRGPANFYVD